MDFHDWIELTRDLQLTGFHRDLANLEGDERADALHADITGMMCEVVEIGDEIGWKPWVKNRGWYNQKEVCGEIVDLLHFVANVLVTCHINAEMLTYAYLEKVEKNRIRQASGDDGVSRRCPHCHRSVDDVGIQEVTDWWDTKFKVKVCGSCHKQLPDQGSW
jgi:hypothetical protein